MDRRPITFRLPSLEPCRGRCRVSNRRRIALRYWSAGPVGRLTSPKKAFQGVTGYRLELICQNVHVFFLNFYNYKSSFFKCYFLQLFSDIAHSIKSQDKNSVVPTSITENMRWWQDNLHGPGPGAYVSRSNFPNEKMRRARSVPDFMSRLGSFIGEIWVSGPQFFP